MAQMVGEKDRSCWKELDDEIIYYFDLNDQSTLIFRNNQTGEVMKYFEIPQNYFKIDLIQFFNIAPISPNILGLLNKQSQYLNVFIKNIKNLKIARLYKSNLKLKIRFRIFKENIYKNSPIHESQNKIILLTQKQKWLQFSKNKQIRKFYGFYDLFLEESVVMKILINQTNSFRKEKQILNEIHEIIEFIFNISLHQKKCDYDPNQFKRKGDFLVLQKKQKFGQIEYHILVYYLHLDLILKGEGKYGKIQLNNQESLKLIKQFDNRIYAVIKEQSQYNIYEIKSEQIRELLFEIKGCSKLRKPILQQKKLILTNENCLYEPIVYEIINEDQKFKVIQQI